MDFKKEIDDLHKHELVIKEALCNEIRKEFDSWHMEKVIVTADVEEDEDLDTQLCDLKNEVGFFPDYPHEDLGLVMTRESELKVVDGELRLYVGDDDMGISKEDAYLDVNKNEKFLSLKDLLGLLTLLKHPLTKELNRRSATLSED